MGMRHKWVKHCWPWVLLLGVMGCSTAPGLQDVKTFFGWPAPQPDLKPPAKPEEINVPPPDDTRYSSPTAYPKDTLNTDLNRKPSAPMDPNLGHQQGMGTMGGFK
jgi:hypothetical protein